MKILDCYWVQHGTQKMLDPIHPGEILIEEFMRPMAVSINQLARKIGVPPGRVGAIVNGKRAITVDTALRLAEILRHVFRTLTGASE